MHVTEDGAALVSVSGKGGHDSSGRPLAGKIAVTVVHYDDYGILVTGVSDVKVARRALKKVGYKGVRSLAYRPTRVDQSPGRWPWGLWVGGKPAVAFYFNPF